MVKQRGRYRLNSDTVQVDLWALRRAHAAARTGTGDERIAALHQACQVYAGELAGGADYEWITRHRKGVLDLAVDAHTALATGLADTDPQQAAQLLQAAADHDPLNEVVCQRAMRAPGTASATPTPSGPCCAASRWPSTRSAPNHPRTRSPWPTSYAATSTAPQIP